MIHLLLYLALEPVKRVLSAVLYPVAYAFRRHVRTTDKLWDGYLYQPKRDLRLLLWLFLDDSAAIEFGKEYADNPKYYPSCIWNTGSDFLRAYWWAAIRNSMVNWNNANAFIMGEYTKTVSRRGSERNFYEVREFASGRRRPYCEFDLFGKWNQVGWIKKGRFEIDVMKRRA